MAYRSAYSHGHTKFDRRILACFSLLVVCCVAVCTLTCLPVLLRDVNVCARPSLCCMCIVCVHAENQSRHTIVHGRRSNFFFLPPVIEIDPRVRKEIRLLLVIKWFLLLLLIIRFFFFLSIYSFTYSTRLVHFIFLATLCLYIISMLVSAAHTHNTHTLIMCIFEPSFCHTMD